MRNRLRRRLLNGSHQVDVGHLLTKSRAAKRHTRQVLAYAILV
jgi:hypothetical protein